ncbi:MAG: rod shape-determining protein MreC [Bdellovibrionaceae bacterium]|nr:rod shape-determining protein MreC [Pseudobdellovibrionaceae bacterium]
MNYFNFSLKKILVTAVVIGLPVFLAVNMMIYTGEPPWYLRPFTFSTSLIQKAFSSFSLEVRGTTGLYLNLISIKKNNKVLLKDNQKFHAQLAAVTELKMENQRLSKLLNFKQQSELKLLAAKIIGKDLLSSHSSLSINMGSRNSIKPGMAVITHAGTVGYILETESFTSRILLLTDRYAAIDAIIQRSRARGIIVGNKGLSCLLNYMKRDDDIVEGDLVVTSGLDKIFPKGFPVGRVKKTTKTQYGMNQTVEVEPIVNPFNLEEVFVILNTNDTQQYQSEPMDGEILPQKEVLKSSQANKVSTTSPTSTAIKKQE